MTAGSHIFKGCSCTESLEISFSNQCLIGLDFPVAFCFVVVADSFVCFLLCLVLRQELTQADPELVIEPPASSSQILELPQDKLTNTIGYKAFRFIIYWSVVVCLLYRSTWEAKAGGVDLCELEAHLVSMVSSRAARAM